MPYIPAKDKPRLDSLIENIRTKTVVLADAHEKMTAAAWGYMRYIARRVLIETALNATEQYQGKRGTRYWLVVDHAGIASNIAFELFDRVLSRNPVLAEQFDFRPLKSEDMPQIPADASSLDSELDALIQEIARISGPDGYNYDGAYCGMDNYSLTELLPRILLSVKEANSASLDWSDIEALIRFWLALKNELYADIARQYEDEQIVKNGDVEVYRIVLEHLRS